MPVTATAMISLSSQRPPVGRSQRQQQPTVPQDEAGQYEDQRNGIVLASSSMTGSPVDAFPKSA
jgi:hypothetical protein